MKIALVHDYIKEYGGAERVLEALHEIYPKAPVFTSVYLPSFLGPHRERFKDWDIQTTWLQYIPFKQKLISPMRLLAPFVFRSFDFSEYDVVIVSATGAYFPNVIKVKSEKRKVSNDKRFAIRHKPVHICYCHTPPRYLYGYATAREWKKNVVFRIVGTIANHLLRMVDFEASKNVDYYIANSEEVAGRIKKFYRRDATVIYPPVEVRPFGFAQGESAKSEVRSQSRNSKFSPRGGAGEIRNYYLAGGRLARPKHIDLIIEACQELDVPLKIFGKGFAGYGDELKSQIANRKSQIEFVGEVTDEKKQELMASAKAYINASEDEDFGILPVEAMAAGIPVIAYRSGGVKETVVEGSPSTGSGSATGLFFDELTVESLSQAIKQFNNVTIDPSVCQKRAGKFSKERFNTEIKEFINSNLKSQSANPQRKA